MYDITDEANTLFPNIHFSSYTITAIGDMADEDGIKGARGLDIP